MKGETPLVPRSAWNAAFWTLRVPFAAERRVVGIPRGAWNENLTALLPGGESWLEAALREIPLQGVAGVGGKIYVRK